LEFNGIGAGLGGGVNDCVGALNVAIVITGHLGHDKGRLTRPNRFMVDFDWPNFHVFLSFFSCLLGFCTALTVL
jgi:hypothetical protein